MVVLTREELVAAVAEAVDHALNGHPRQLLTESEAAELLSISRRTLQRWAARGIGPPALALPSATPDAPPIIRYRRADLDKWAARHRRT